jgi:murein DD-endopeptidase MepM/ murein hydrolase activator NlpD
MLENSTNNDHFDHDLISLGATFSNLSTDIITPNTQKLGLVANNSFAPSEILSASLQADPGNSITEAKDLGLVTGSKQANDWVGSTDGQDYYHFRTDRLGDLDYHLTGLSNNANIQLLNIGGGTISGSYKSGSQSEDKTYNNLAPGDYYFKVYGGDTNYNLAFELSNSDPGNSILDAKDLGLVTGSKQESGWIGSTDTSDYYRFRTDRLADLDYSLTGLSDNANVQLLNSNGSIVSGSYKSGSQSEGYSHSKLAAGDYYLKIYGKDTNYNLAFGLGSQSAITVTSPNGGNQLEAGKSYNFTWTDNISENVRLNLYQGGTFKQTINSNTPSDGSHYWTLPANLAPGSNYRIKIASVSNSNVDDWSDSEFTVQPKPQITVTSPNGGNQLEAGKTHNFTWTDNISENVRLDLYQENTLKQTISSNTPSDGSYNWTLPANLTTASNYKLKVSSVSNINVADWSNNYFTINPKPQITLTSPDGGNQLKSGENLSITWTDNISENVNIDLYRDDTFVQSIAGNTASDGQSFWTVPTNLPLSDRYKIKVSKSGDSSIGDLSDNYFSVYQPNITLTSPNGGNKLTPGENINITWTDNISENVEINLFVESDTPYVQTINDSTPSDGGYLWQVPEDLPTDAQYKITISSFSNPAITDTSDDYFTIKPNVVHKVDDFNGDGKHDILWRQLNNGIYHAWAMNGLNRLDGITLEGIEDANDTAWHPVALGDFNGDGNTDIVARYLWNNNPGFNRIWLMNDNQKIGQIELPRESNLNWNVGGTGDFNQDGSLDILWRNHQTGENNVWLMNGTGRIGNVALKNEANPNLKIAGTGDFNKDGNIDILWRNYQTGENNVWLMNGTNHSQNVGIMTVPDLNWQIAGTGDFNQDSNIDILFRHLPTGENHVWLMNGTNFTESKQIPIVPGKEWHIVGESDTIPTWTAEYYNNKTLSGTPVYTEGVGTSYSSNSYGELSLNWGLGSPKNTPADGFSAKFKTKRYLAPGLYQIQTGADDGIRVIIDGQKVTDRWVFGSGDSGYFYSNGKEHDIQVEYYEEGGGASLDLKIKRATKIDEPVNESQEWKTSIYNWNPTQSNQPPQDFFIDNNKLIGTVNLGSNIRSDGKFGINVDWQNGAIKGDNRLPHDNFAIRSYTHKLLEAGKTYKATVTGDDGFQLFAKQWHTNNVVDLLSNRRQVPTGWTQNYPSQGAKTYEFTVDNTAWYDLAFQMFEVNSPSSFDFKLEQGCGNSVPNLHANPTQSNPLKGFVHPLNGSGTITQGNNGSTSHTGKQAYAIDYGVDIGTPIYAMRSGTVTSVIQGYPDTGGGPEKANQANLIEIDHGGGYYSGYLHLQNGFASKVNIKPGDTVQAGQLIGYSGNSGWSTGSHLHVEVHGHENGYWGQTVPFEIGNIENTCANSGIGITTQQVADSIGGFKSQVDTYYSKIVDALKEFNILDRNTLIATVATIRTETGGFQPIHEYGGDQYFTNLYENRSDLGNIYPGDGAKYHGRGFIQVTGRNNYQYYGNKLGVDLINNPNLALDPTISARILASYFVDRGISTKANQGNWNAVRYAVNGGYNGLDTFLNVVNSASQIYPIA